MKLSRFLRTFFVPLFLLTTLALAATDAPVHSKPAPIVTIIKSDGTMVRGHLASSDPDQVTLQPTPTAKEADPAPVSVPWKDIKAVSSGLTRAKALAQWKIEHHDDLCPTCHGDRTVACSTCKGTGKDPAARKDCPTCHGELLIDCKTPREKDGKIPCPNHCLQFTEGQWGKQGDLRVRYYHFPHGSAWISEHHLGHMMVIDPKLGTITDNGVCPVCNGTTVIPDPVCEGTGKMPCPTCVHDKSAPACPAHCDNGRVVCPTCGGTGLKKT